MGFPVTVPNRPACNDALVHTGASPSARLHQLEGIPWCGRQSPTCSSTAEMCEATKRPSRILAHGTHRGLLLLCILTILLWKSEMYQDVPLISLMFTPIEFCIRWQQTKQLAQATPRTPFHLNVRSGEHLSVPFSHNNSSGLQINYTAEKHLEYEVFFTCFHIFPSCSASRTSKLAHSNWVQALRIERLVGAADKVFGVGIAAVRLSSGCDIAELSFTQRSVGSLSGTPSGSPFTIFFTAMVEQLCSCSVMKKNLKCSESVNVQDKLCVFLRYSSRMVCKCCGSVVPNCYHLCCLVGSDFVTSFRHSHDSHPL